MPDAVESIISVIVTLLFIVAIFVGAYFTTKFVGGKYQFSTSKNKMKVLERTAMGKDTSLVIVKVDGKVFLLGVTAHGFTKIEELNPESFPDEVVEDYSNKNFSEIFKETLKKNLPFNPNADKKDKL